MWVPASSLCVNIRCGPPIARGTLRILHDDHFMFVENRSYRCCPLTFAPPHVEAGRMKRVAIFGNAGGGKSTLARELAAITGLPLHVIDKMAYRPGDVDVSHDEYVQLHADLVNRDEWIIDGFGCLETLWKRLEAADTLVHIDLTLAFHALGVTKRLVKGLFVPPEGWPEKSPKVIRWSFQSYRVLWPCHSRLTPKYRSYVSEAAQRKRVFHLRSRQDLKQFLQVIRDEVGSTATRAGRHGVQPAGKDAS
jgi:adenylate kinase family enzyme